VKKTGKKVFKKGCRNLNDLTRKTLKKSARWKEVVSADSAIDLIKKLGI
jgi:hypothetical protein